MLKMIAILLIIVAVLSLAAIIVFSTNTPSITYPAPTLPDNSIPELSSYLVNISIDNGDNPITNINYSWNYTNYSYYDPSLVLMMNFDNNTITGDTFAKAVDNSQYSNNGTFQSKTAVNPRWIASGKYGYGIEFDPSRKINMTINITTTPSIRLGNGSLFSIEAWVYMKGTNQGVYTIQTLLSSSDNVKYGYKIWCFWTVGCTLTYGNGTGVTSSGYTGLINDSKWHYIVAVLNSTNMTLYLDGKLNGTYSNLGTYKEKIGSLYIGNDPYITGTEIWNGTIDEVRIWNRTLSLAEIIEHNNSNMYKYNQTNWDLNVIENNLVIGTNYTYQAYAQDSGGSIGYGTLMHLNNSFMIPYCSYESTTTNIQTKNPESVNVTLTHGAIQYRNINYSWNGVNYSLYDSNLFVMYNFNDPYAFDDQSLYNFSTWSLLGGKIYCGIFVSCPTYSIGKYNGSYMYNSLDNTGSGDYLTILNFMNYSTQFSIEAWVKFTNITDSLNHIIAIKGNFTKGTSWYLFQVTALGYGINNEVFFEVYNTSGYNHYARSWNAHHPVLNTWYHYVGVFNGSDVLLYVNGTLVNNVSFIGTYQISNYNITLGAAGDIPKGSVQNNFPLNGSIDEFMFYNRSLTADEILLHYQTNLYKINNTALKLLTEFTQLNINNTYTYQMCINDNLTRTNCTQMQSLVGFCRLPPTLFWQQECSNICNISQNYIMDSKLALNGTGSFNLNSFNITTKGMNITKGCKTIIPKESIWRIT